MFQFFEGFTKTFFCFQLRANFALSQQKTRLCLLHYGSDKRGGQALLSQRAEDWVDQRRTALRYTSRDVSVNFWQSSLHWGSSGHDEGREAPAHRCIGVLWDFSFLYCFWVSLESYHTILVFFYWQFYFFPISHDMVIRNIGNSLIIILPNLIGKKMTHRFDLVRPLISFKFQSVKDRSTLKDWNHMIISFLDSK